MAAYQGNAKIAGIEKDLGLQGVQYNVALTIFYVAYIIIEIPSNLALKHFGSIWLAFLIICFGSVTIGTAFVHNFGQLIATRILLGIAEGGTLVGAEPFPCYLLQTNIINLISQD